MLYDLMETCAANHHCLKWYFHPKQGYFKASDFCVKFEEYTQNPILGMGLNPQCLDPILGRGVGFLAVS